MKMGREISYLHKKRRIRVELVKREEPGVFPMYRPIASVKREICGELIWAHRTNRGRTLGRGETIKRGHVFGEKKGAH